MIRVAYAVLVAGAIILADNLFYHKSLIYTSAILFIASILIAIITYKCSKSYVAPTISIILLALTCIHVGSQAHPKVLPLVNEPNRVTLEGIVDKRPTNNGKEINIELSQVTYINQNKEKQSLPGKAIATLPLYSLVRYGDVVRISGSRSDLLKGDPGYKDYLIHHQIYTKIQYASLKILSHNKGNILISWSIALQERIEKSVDYLLPQDDIDFILGVVLGLQESISDQFSQALRNTGTTHIIVASGYNLSIILALFAKAAPNIGKKKSLLLAAIPTVCYIFISGAQPSIIRAGVIASIICAIELLGRQRESLNILSIAWCCMLLFWPLWLYDTSFQLSFAATLGIIMFEPLLKSKTSQLPGWVSEGISTTAAAQVFVLPILASTFNTMSVASIIVNVLVLWAIPLIMAGGAVVIVCSLLLQSLGKIAAYLVEPLVIYVKSVINIFSSIPDSSIIFHPNILFVTIYIIVLIWLFWWRWRFDESQY